MAGLNAVVFGIVRNTTHADKTIGRLTSAGFSNSDISLLSSILDGYLAGLKIPGYQAERFERLVKDGRILVSVHCVNSLEIDRAQTILTETGAQEVFSSSEPVSETQGVHWP